MGTEDEVDAALRRLQESLDYQPDDPSLQFNLGVLLWEQKSEFREKAVEHFVMSAKLNPHNGAAFRYLGHYYSSISVDHQRALKCYQRAININPDDGDAGEAICDLLDQAGKVSLEVATCREASERSARAFWAFRRLGYLQAHQKRWSEAIQSLQHAIRGFPTCADLWETLGLAYQRMGMFTAALKSYGRAIDLEDSRVFALIESGNISLMLGSFRKAVEQFQTALRTAPHDVSAHYGLATALLGLAKECIGSAAFNWGASLLKEASEVAIKGTQIAGNFSCLWKLRGDIQLMSARCFPWSEGKCLTEPNEKAFYSSISDWRRSRMAAAMSACSSYQRALHLAPWQANIYADIAIASDLSSSLEENLKEDLHAWSVAEKLCLGSILLEGHNDQFWVVLGCLSQYTALKQHAFIRGLQLDASLAVAWAYLGKLYRQEGEKQLAQQAFDRARSLDPSLALPWAGMAADADTRKFKPDESYECCLRAVQIFPLAEFQIGLGMLALHSGYLTSSEVFGATRHALQHAPHYPESHNLNGLVCESRSDYQGAISSYQLARWATRFIGGEMSRSYVKYISINLARSLCQAGDARGAVEECEYLKKEGLIDLEGMQIYALCLWQLSENDQALSVTRTLAASIRAMDQKLAAVSICFVCRLLYYISGEKAAILSILKMPRELFQSSKISFVVSAINVLDQSNQLEPIASSSRSSLISHEEITAMHFLIALGKLVKYGSGDCLAIQKGVNHLKKALHMFPNDGGLRNLLGYLLLSSKEWKDPHLATRCPSIDLFDAQKEECMKSSSEILGAGEVACYSTGSCGGKLVFPACRPLYVSKSGTVRQLQRFLHQEPWSLNVRYLLTVNYLQKAREERFPQHLCLVVERLTCVALSSSLYLRKALQYEYQKFQLLLCAAEVSLQQGKHIECLRHAQTASGLLVPDSCLFFAHLLLCRAYASKDNLAYLSREYRKCLELKTDYHIGWICLKFIESRYELEKDSTVLALNFEECSKDIETSWNIYMALFNLAQGLIAVSSHDLGGAEEFFTQACSLATSECYLFLCHGVVCMELARQQCNAEYLSCAVRSLRKAKEISARPVPFISLLLAQAEASLGYKSKWLDNLQDELFSWPPETRPAELLFQMHLVSRELKDGFGSSSSSGSCRSPPKWILEAIHLNPSCSRYWKYLLKTIE